MISASAPGKLNLFFSVGRSRDDGYHDVYSIYQAIGLRDNVKVAVAEADSLKITGNLSNEQLDAVPKDQTNICFLAARAFFEHNELDSTPLAIEIEKHIPVAAGLAGGSADAAATLIALQELFQTESDLYAIASEIGADVPFSLLGGTAIGSGSGTELEPIDSAEVEFLIAYPDQGISTKESFALLDRLRAEEEEIQLRLPGSDFYEDLRLGEKPSQLGQNDLAAPALELMPSLQELIELGGNVSGSGPSVYFFEPDATLISALQESEFSWVLTSGNQPGARLEV